MLLKADNFIID